MKNVIAHSLLITGFLIFTHYAMADDETSIPAKVTGEPRDLAGRVTRAKGKVYYHENNSARSKRIEKEPQNLFVADILRTKNDSQAFLTLTDESKLVLDENSIIHFNGVKQITAEKGIILFNIKKQGGLKGLKITTKTAVIGIKGTKFIIDTSDSALKLYMKEGMVNVQAIDNGTFEHHIKDKQSYKDYLKDMFTSFSEYKQKQEEEFVEFVKSIDVPEHKAISINGNKLVDIDIPDYIQEQFKLLDELTSTDADTDTNAGADTVTEADESKKDPFEDEIFKKQQ